jgi:hypothetical protein
MRYVNLLGPCLVALVVACAETNEPEPTLAAAGVGGEADGSAGDGSPGAESGAGGALGEGGAPVASAGLGGMIETGAAGAAGIAGAEETSAGAGGEPAAYACDGEGARFVTSVIDHEFGDGQDFGQEEFPAPILGAPLGGGCCQGSLDVTSLGEGGFVIVEFDGNVIVDGEGPDFIVFENAFVPSGAEASAVFAEIGSVSVSQDGVEWHSFPCTADEYPFGDCAGWHPVLSNPDDGETSPFDPETAGGDAYDLGELGLDFARYVRIEDRVDVDGTFDLDAVAIVHPGCP